jgi:acyl carrier protein
MATTSTQLLADVLELMTQLAGDWEYDGPITADTFLFADLGLESLDLVVLGTSVQERYGRMPFAEFLAQVGQRTLRDVSVGELAAFIDEHRDGAQAKTTHEGLR